MSRSDHAPTSHLRWMVRHRKGVRIGVLLYMVFGIGLTIDRLSRGESGTAVAVELWPTLLMPVLVLISSWSGCRYVEAYDARHVDPSSDY